MRAGDWVKHERLDDEVMVIDLNSGAYFSFVGAAADAWSLLAAGHDIDAISLQLAERYDTTATTVATDLGGFITELTAEGLLVDGSVSPAPEIDLGEPTIAYEVPSLEKYDDLADLLLLDPVHEVEPTGWPAGREQ